MSTLRNGDGARKLTATPGEAAEPKNQASTGTSEAAETGASASLQGVPGGREQMTGYRMDDARDLARAEVARRLASPEFRRMSARFARSEGVEARPDGGVPASRSDRAVPVSLAAAEPAVAKAGQGPAEPKRFAAPLPQEREERVQHSASPAERSPVASRLLAAGSPDGSGD